MSKNRNTRQTFLGETSDKIFENTIIGVVGLGGGGSHIVQQLAHVGFQQYELFDDDIVEESNLNRLVGATVRDTEDTNKETKLATAERIIRGIQPNANINGHPCKWQDAADYLKRCHLVFGCMDSFLSRDLLERFTRRFLIAYVDIGMDVNIGADGQPVMGGQVIASLPDHACMRCMGFITDDRLMREVEKYGDAGSRPQVVWANGVLASNAVGIGVDLLTNWTRHVSAPIYLEYDGNKYMIKNISWRFEGCICRHYSPDHVGEPVFSPLSST